jgi:hypothetical protein
VVTVVIIVVASSAPSIVVVASTVVVVAVVVNTRSLSVSRDGVPGVVVGPEPALSCRCRRLAPFSTVLMPRGGGFGPCADGAVARPHSDRWRDAERRGVTISIGIDVHAFVGMSVIVACVPSSRRHQGVGSRLFGGRTALLPLTVPLTGLFLHRDQL